MALKLFDLDISLKKDTSTNDFKEEYNEDVVNQSIDLFITHPYRIGVGLTNTIMMYVFADLNIKTEIDISREIREEIENNYQLLILNSVDTKIDYDNRRLYVVISWTLRKFGVSGTYKRYWSE